MTDSRRPPGRPPLDDSGRSVPVCVRVPARTYDELHDRAKRERVSVPELLRRGVDPKVTTRN